MKPFSQCEKWLDPLGREAYLVPMGQPIDEDGWYPDEPGQRPPYMYRLVKADNPRLWLERVVVPYDPWSPYDAISDLLRHEGWKCLEEEDFQVCEHGMNAAHCGGPMHWHD